MGACLGEEQILFKKCQQSHLEILSNNEKNDNGIMLYLNNEIGKLTDIQY